MALAVHVPHQNGLHHVIEAVGSFFAIVAAAGRAANAVENHRAPASADLATLGIPAQSMPRA